MGMDHHRLWSAVGLLVLLAVNAHGQRRGSYGAGVTQATDFDCPEEFGYYPHPSDCTQYYVCVFGGALLESCTGGLMYSHELQTCDWPRNVGCGADSAADTPTPARSAPPPAPRAPLRQQPVLSREQQQQERRQRIEQEEIAKQQLYAEDLGPAEEVESDRQQRVYRGQPSSLGQVARDRDGLRHQPNTIQAPSTSRDKASVVSYATQQPPYRPEPSAAPLQYSPQPPPPPQPQPSPTTGRSVFTRPANTSYQPSNYDQYYAVYDDDDQLYRDVDYGHFQNNQGSAPQPFSRGNNNQNNNRAQPQNVEIITQAQPQQQSQQQPQQPQRQANTYVSSSFNVQSQDSYAPTVSSQDYNDNYNVNVQYDVDDTFPQTKPTSHRHPNGLKRQTDQSSTPHSHSAQDYFTPSSPFPFPNFYQSDRFVPSSFPSQPQRKLEPERSSSDRLVQGIFSTASAPTPSPAARPQPPPPPPPARPFAFPERSFSLPPDFQPFSPLEYPSRAQQPSPSPSSSPSPKDGDAQQPKEVRILPKSQITALQQAAQPAARPTPAELRIVAKPTSPSATSSVTPSAASRAPEVRILPKPAAGATAPKSEAAFREEFSRYNYYDTTGSPGGSSTPSPRWVPLEVFAGFFQQPKQQSPVQQGRVTGPSSSPSPQLQQRFPSTPASQLQQQQRFPSSPPPPQPQQQRFPNSPSSQPQQPQQLQQPAQRFSSSPAPPQEQRFPSTPSPQSQQQLPQRFASSPAPAQEQRFPSTPSPQSQQPQRTLSTPEQPQARLIHFPQSEADAPGAPSTRLVPPTQTRFQGFLDGPASGYATLTENKFSRPTHPVETSTPSSRQQQAGRFVAPVLNSFESSTVRVKPEEAPARTTPVKVRAGDLIGLFSPAPSFPREASAPRVVSRPESNTVAQRFVEPQPSAPSTPPPLATRLRQVDNQPLKTVTEAGFRSTSLDDQPRRPVSLEYVTIQQLPRRDEQERARPAVTPAAPASPAAPAAPAAQSNSTLATPPDYYYDYEYDDYIDEPFDFVSGSQPSSRAPPVSTTTTTTTTSTTTTTTTTQRPTTTTPETTTTRRPKPPAHVEKARTGKTVHRVEDGDGGRPTAASPFSTARNEVSYDDGQAPAHVRAPALRSRPRGSVHYSSAEVQDYDEETPVTRHPAPPAPATTEDASSRPRAAVTEDVSTTTTTSAPVRSSSPSAHEEVAPRTYRPGTPGRKRVVVRYRPRSQPTAGEQVETAAPRTRRPANPRRARPSTTEASREPDEEPEAPASVDKHADSSEEENTPPPRSRARTTATPALPTEAPAARYPSTTYHPRRAYPTTEPPATTYSPRHHPRPTGPAPSHAPAIPTSTSHENEVSPSDETFPAARSRSPGSPLFRATVEDAASQPNSTLDRDQDVGPEAKDTVLRLRPTTASPDSLSTPGVSRGSVRGRGKATYTAASETSRGTPSSVARGSRPTLKPSTAIVSKAQEFVDIYKFPPSRPESVYPTPTPDKSAAKCRKDVCLLPDCNCGGKDIPGDLSPEEVPQIVLLTFDDSVNDLNKGLYTDLFEKGRTNPNGCPIAATFYVSHEWTDYSQVQNLYSAGHEIASHSVSHSFGEQFSQKKWTKEIAGQREILAAYGGVKQEDIRGMRAPFLAVGGNKMFKMLYDSNFTYDSSMPVYENKPPSWPYTLDYKLFHDCMIPPCPTRSYPGVWEVPMVMWTDLNGGRCSMGDACSNPPTADGVYKMLIKNFERHYTTNRAPFGLFYHAAWFTQPHHKEGFIAFLDTLVSMNDVWLVTNWQALQWVRDPTPISRLGNFQPFQCNYQDRPRRCNNPKVCNLWHKSGVRYMRTCQPCPDVYPWTGKSGVRNSRVDNDIE